MLFYPKLLWKAACAINCLTYDENTRQPYNDNLCLFSALALHLSWNQRLEEETSEIYNSFKVRMDWRSPIQFERVHMNNFPSAEDLITLNILLHDMDIVEITVLDNLVNDFRGNTNNTVWLLRYNNHICFFINIDLVLFCFCWFNCDNFFKTTFILERTLSACSKRVRNVYTRKVYRIGECLFDK